VQVNATAAGGGVAELPASFIPLARGLGLDVERRLLRPDDALFAATKHLHNALQDQRIPLSGAEIAVYEERSAHCAPMLGSGWDVALVHDPQPAALRLLAPAAAAHWIWRCHIDTSDPEPGASSHMRPAVEGCERTVFTLEEFAPAGLRAPVEVIPPAIDPLASKNVELPAGLARAAVARFGPDPARPRSEPADGSGCASAFSSPGCCATSCACSARSPRAPELGRRSASEVSGARSDPEGQPGAPSGSRSTPRRRGWRAR
jgi:trehalose synthase